ncbi:MAG: HYR domain-containing protein [Bacteroidales bacterium]
MGLLPITSITAIAQSVTLSAQPVTCTGSSDGSINLTITGGTGPFTFTWTGPGSFAATTEDLTGLAGGTYTVTVKDSVFEQTLSTTVDESASLLSLEVSAIPVNCFGGSDGSINLTVTGGTGPYTYAWTGPGTFAATTEDLTGLVAGSYTVVVTDEYGCSQTADIIITQPAAALTASITAQTNILCFGNSTGTATVTVTGGTGPYSWSWNTTPGQTAATATGLSAGTYIVNVTDARGCTKTATAILTQPAAALTATITAQTNILCFGNATGTATVTATGGTGAYTYSWNTTPEQTDATATGLTAGTYIVTVTDANTCTWNTTSIITQPADSLAFTTPAITDVSCAGGNDGAIVINTTGGTGSITFIISPSLGNQSPAGTFTGLTAQAYSIVATDQNGCSKTTSITVNTIPDITLPIITGCPVNVTVFTGPGRTTCDAAASWTEPAATDNCTVTGSLVWTKTHAPGATFPSGTTTITYTVKDLLNNMASCSFTVTVTDNTPPTFVTPLAITVYINNSCVANTTPAFTGSPTGLLDNCTPIGGLTVTSSDGAPVTGCTGLYSLTRTWSVMDAAGNTATGTQLITVADAIQPILTKPADASIQCGQSALPAFTGTATAVDNCNGTVTVTYSDVTTAGSCPGNSYIARTWRAEDCSGNISTAIQNITITDATNPTIVNVQNISVGCPSDIPAPDGNVVTATDNCGTVNISLFQEIPNGLAGKPGYCPTSVTRIYRVTDACGNYTDATQTISVSAACGCSPCTTGTAFYLVDLAGQPTGSSVISDASRNGLCCDAANPKRCISFNVRLDADAVGIEILINGASPDYKEWKIDCVDISIVGNVVCIPSGSFHLFTFCKEGSNQNSYSFRSVAGVIASQDISARVDCQGQLTASGIVSDPTWTSVSPGAVGEYDHYLSCTNCMNPIFTADSLTPSIIKYKVCGNIGSTVCSATGIDCDTISVYVKEKIEINLDVNAQLLCSGVPAVVSAVVYPAANYTFEWYTGSNAIGVPFSTASSFTVTTAGPYSVRVTDTQNGIPCSSAVYNFTVGYDVIGPVVLAPPSGDLVIACDNPNAPQLISNWLASASGTYTKPDGTIVTLVPDNDYAGNIAMLCGTVVPVTFSAADQCGNLTTVVASIRVSDTTAPVMTFSPADVSGYADNAECFATGIVLGQATATDNCSTPVVTNNAPAQFPVGITIVTWTATDPCGNIATRTQTVTIIDNNQPPVITCPAPVIQTALPDNCALDNVTIPNPVYIDNCGVTQLTWTLSGKTTGSSPATGINYAGGQTFNVGLTTVTYIASDAAGNSDTCSFTVWIKDLVKPVFSIGCPPDITQFADANACNAAVTVPDPSVSDPCGEILSVLNSFNNTPHASGIYPVGSTIVQWTITDESGNITTCDQTITVVDNQGPVLTCPAPETVTATAPSCVFPAVVIGPLTSIDNCGVATTTWAKTGATMENGTGDVNGTSFNVGVTTVTYTVTDIHGNSSNCSFAVTVRDQIPPTILTCPANIVQNVDANSCTAAVIVSDPVVIDPCGEIVSVVNSFNNTAHASGTYPAGITLVTWTFTDDSGNQVTCTQTINIVDNILPVITCPGNVEQILLDEGCTLSNVTIADPTFSDNCSFTVTWSMTGATTGSSPATGINFASGQTFHVGITQVTYTITDIGGNQSSCSFNVWIKDFVRPVFNVGCPADLTVDTDAGMCSASLIIPVPLVSDPCDELVSIVNSFNGTDNASGNYPIGTTLVTWTITDLSGNPTTCVQTITVNDLLPSLTCPPSIVVNADFNQPFATNVNIGTPTYSDNCPGFTLTWVSSAPTPGNSLLTGVNIDTVSTFYPGVTTITYTLTDAHSHTVTCSFTVTVLAKPVIVCRPDTTRFTDPGLCSAAINPGEPTLVSGAVPVTWTWTMTGATVANGSGSPIVPNPFAFNAGVTAITWVVTNISGTDTCLQMVTVIDNEPPTFTVPDSISFCVVNLSLAEFTSNNLKINPEPDYYRFLSASTSLNLDPDLYNFNDNCCADNQLVLHWRIDFSNTPNPAAPPAWLTFAPIEGTGQPSDFGSDIQFPGDGVTFLPVIHTITYWLVDCNNNISDVKVMNITITPRPRLIKLN